MLYNLNFDFTKEESEGRDLPLIFLGGSSFIGLNSAQALFYYYDIYSSFYKSQAPNFFPEFIWSRINFSDSKMHNKLLQSLIRKSNAKFLINFIDIIPTVYPEVSIKESLKKNIEINSSIIELCNKYEVISLFISSDHVFSGIKGPYSEYSTPQPSTYSSYGQQKYAVEQLYQDNANNYAILRLSSIFGLNLHFQKENLYSRVLSSIKNGNEVKGATNKFRSPSYVYNVAFFLHKFIEKVIDGNLKENKSIFHLPGDYMSEFDFFKEIANSHQCDENLIIPYEKNGPEKQIPLNLGLKAERTKNLIDARYLSLKESLSVLNLEFNTLTNSYK